MVAPSVFRSMWHLVQGDRPPSSTSVCAAVTPSSIRANEPAVNRRAFLRMNAALIAGLAWVPPRVSAEGRDLRELGKIHDGIAVHMRRLYQACRIGIDGYHLLRPCDNPAYRGLWHDDFTWPHVGLPELQKNPEMRDAVTWLGEAMLRLPVVADRVEFDGTAVMSPGGAQSKAMSEDMPIHLPSAWTRLLSHAEAAGVVIPRKREWAELIRRSFERVAMSFGLVWNDPQRHTVAFGFQDSIRLTGLVLLTSLVVKRGYERAAALFANELPPAVTDDWKVRATSIGANLHRLFDSKTGGFVGATVAGRAFDVWGNGLAWPLATGDQKNAIAATLVANKDRIFLNGCTRQIIGPGGWPGTEGGIGYQNGGYWGTGTGFVLPMIAEIDPAWAIALAGDLLAHLDGIKRAEWIDAQGNGKGTLEFLGTLSMPLIGLRAILEGKHTLDYL